MTDETRASLELLYNVSRELTSALDLHTVLARVMFLSTSNVQAERGSVIVIDEQQHPVDAAVIFAGQFMSHTVDQLKSTLEQGLAGWVVRNREPALVRDTSQDMRWLHRRYDEERGEAKSAVCVPIMVRDELVGVLTLVHATPNFFTSHHLALLQAIADQAGIAIHNARLYESLQASNRRYHELFEDSIDPILVTDVDGRIIESNRQAAAVSGRTDKQLLGTYVWDLHGKGPEWLLENFPAIKAGETVSCQTELYAVNHPKLPVELHVRKISFGREELLQWIIRDISERRQLDTLRDDLAAMIYHDLRSPLSNIISSLDLVRITTEDNDMVQQVLAIAMRSSDRMQRLINSLLDINRLEAGQPITNRSAVEITGLVNEAVDTIQPITSTKRQTVKVDLETPLPRIWADEDMIRRVLINLLENATKFTPIEGTVSVGARADNGWVRLWVKDTGPGIPAEAQEKIFQKFSSIPSNRGPAERLPKGLGLGLAFCKLAVKAHGGEIGVESKPGAGSCFQFTMPVAKES